MRRRTRWGLLLIVALTIVGTCAMDGPNLFAAVKNSDRAMAWEFTIPIRYINGTSIEAEGGTSVSFDDDVSWGFGFGYNFNEKFNLGFEISWSDFNYDVEFASADVPGLTAKGTGSMDASNSSFNFTYNIIPKTITPYVSASVGWTWVDSNIPNGSPDVGCWWDPWYGQICTSYQDTFEDDAFSYGLGAGIRFEATDTFFLRFGVNNVWQDFGGNYNNDAEIFSVRMDIAWKF
jgi:opacity protein-like surface antigen